MAVHQKPLEKISFGGVVTSGNPLERIPESASKCEDFRVMPGKWLRLRGGCKARMYKPTTTSSFLQIWKATDPMGFGATDHIVQHHDGTNVKWRDFNLSTWIVNPVGSGLTISTSYGGSFAATEAAPITQLNNRVLLYNGYGVRATASTPPFSAWSSSGTRYFGLDAYCPSSNPSAAFAAGAGNNEVETSVQIWVGLYNSGTGHYSNGVYAGTITTTGATGTITVSNLSNLKYVTNGASETSELKYVFYATLDGGQVPYLILNSTYTGPLTAAVTDSTKSLSVLSGTDNGWALDLTAECPTKNFPPRPMRDVAYVGGRIYGVLASGSGSGSVVAQTKADGTMAADFTYVPNDMYYGGIVYSAAASDLVEADWLGSPQESWPLENFSPTPNSEVPIRVTPAPDGYRLLVLTKNGAFLVEEAVDGLHEWTSVSLVHGIYRKETYQLTPYGSVWVTQRNQIVLLRPGAETLEILSIPYQSLLSGLTPRFGFYLLDPLNEIDKYEVFFTNGTSVVHDFALDGAGYTTTNRDFNCGATVMNTTGSQYHLVAKTHMYSIEGQADESGKEVTYDEDYTGPSTKAKTQISGEWRGQWNDFGDSNVRKDIHWIDVIGDREIEMEWYADFTGVAEDTPKLTRSIKTSQSDTDCTYRFSMSNGNRFWYKIALALTGRSSEQTTYDNPASQGDLASNFYGGIQRLLGMVEFGNRS